jgi:hypothetical protein
MNASDDELLAGLSGTLMSAPAQEPGQMVVTWRN